MAQELEHLSLEKAASPDAAIHPKDGFFTPSAIEPMFWRPRFMPGSPLLLYTPFLFWLCNSIRPQETAVLGVGDGVAYFALCQAMDKLNLRGLCHGHGYWVDAGDGSVRSEAPPDLIAHAEQFYDDRSVLQAWPEGSGRIRESSIDLLFVDLDGLPDEDSLQPENWLNLVKPDGVLVLHGTSGMPGRSGRLAPLADRIAGMPGVSFRSGQGLIALPLGQPAPRLQALLDICREGHVPHEVERIFQRLGRGLMATAGHEALARRLREAEQGLREAEEARKRLESDLGQAGHEEAEAHRNRLRQAEEALEAERRTRFSETTVLTRRLEEMRRETEAGTRDLLARAKAAELHVAELRDSTSWRITGPLRMIGSAFGKKRRKKKKNGHA